jgi:predicted restriction endonuclease
MKNLHDIIQKNSETFEKEFKYLYGDKFAYDTDYPKVKKYFLSSQLSIIQAIDGMIDEVIKKKEQVNGFQPYHTCDEECEVHCKKERDEKKIFFDGFDDGRNMMKIDLLDLINIIQKK